MTIEAPPEEQQQIDNSVTILTNPAIRNIRHIYNSDNQSETSSAFYDRLTLIGEELEEEGVSEQLIASTHLVEGWIRRYFSTWKEGNAEAMEQGGTVTTMKAWATGGMQQGEYFD